MTESGRETDYYPTPEEVLNYSYTSEEKAIIKSNRKRMIVGDPDSVKEQIVNLATLYRTNEVLLLPNIPGAKNRSNSLHLLAQSFELS